MTKDAEAVLEQLSESLDTLLDEVNEWIDDDGELTKEVTAIRANSDEVEELKIEIDSAHDDISEVVEGIRKGRRDSAELASLLVWEKDIQQAMESLGQDLERLSPNLRKHVCSLFDNLKLATVTLGASILGRRDFYVYVHKDLEGKVFYVGKGRGNRATSQARNAYWQTYVNERLGGKFEVEIVKKDLLEHESEDIERQLIAQYGDALVNMQTGERSGIEITFDPESMNVDMSLFGRKNHDEDYFQKLQECIAQSDAIQTLTENAKASEEVNTGEAMALYREAIDATQANKSNWPKEPGLKGQLTGQLACSGVELRPLDRLTLLQKKARRLEELVETVEKFFSASPGSNSGSVADTIIKRSNAAKLLLAKKSNM